MRRARPRVWWLALVLIGATIALSGATSAARAQISPGPLSEPHTDLEGVTNCLKCHEVGKRRVDSKCLACHEEVAFLREQGRGFHARAAGGECGSCHPEHGGRSFEIIDWPSGSHERFDHSRTGWKLDGQHATTDCAECHATRFHEATMARLRPGGLRSDSWMGLSTTCSSCHDDPHKERFGNDCRECHQTIGWRELRKNSFDHTQTRYPLLGLHANVDCSSCHTDGYDALPAFTECRSCHADPHKGQATIQGVAQDCAACHSVDGFSPSTFDRDRHQNTPYTLVGRHQQVSCLGCHGGRDATFRFRLDAEKCANCHEDAHAGQFSRNVESGDCSACHDVQGFESTSFTVADHEDLRFPLWGAHSAVACRACHAPASSANVQKSLGSAGIRFHFDVFDCVTCHVDPHGETLGRQDEHCLQCHNASRFVPSQVDASMHEQFEFALEGSHLAIGCGECHAALMEQKPASTLKARASSWPLLSFRVANHSCESCHADPHGGQFESRQDGGACADCHTTETFRPAVRFDHDRDSGFSLEGAHAQVACVACHPHETLTGDVETFRYVPTTNRCEDCHSPGTVGEKP